MKILGLLNLLVIAVQALNPLNELELTQIFDLHTFEEAISIILKSGSIVKATL